MSTPSYTVVIDHNDPAHDQQMSRAARELAAWSARYGLKRVVREERELRPGVMQLRFVPAASAPVPQGDRLTLTGCR